MTIANYPTDRFDRPDGRDMHYRFDANDEEAWRRLRIARWAGRYMELYPKDMKHLRTKINHVTLKTYDSKGYISGMKKYAKSPSWEKIPHHRGAEMKHANGGGSKIREEVRINEKYGMVPVEYTVDATPGEIRDAFENGVEEDAIATEMAEAGRWAVDDKLDELREEELRYQEECSHDHVVKNNRVGCFAFCEDCFKEWREEMEFQHDYHNDELTLVGSTS